MNIIHVAFKAPRSTFPIARKGYLCFLCKKPIDAGTKYVRDITAPWQQVEDDCCDDEGRRIAFIDRAVGWTVYKYHPDCWVELDE